MVTWGEIGTCPGPHTGMFCHVDRFVNRVRHWGFGNAMRGSARRMMALVADHDVKLNGRFDSPCVEMSVRVLPYFLVGGTLHYLTVNAVQIHSVILSSP